MKVFILKPDSHDDFLNIKVVHFNEWNREALRKSIINEYQTPHVWFEDEEPPQEFVVWAIEAKAKHEQEFGSQDTGEADQVS